MEKIIYRIDKKFDIYQGWTYTVYRNDEGVCTESSFTNAQDIVDEYQEIDKYNEKLKK